MKLGDFDDDWEISHQDKEVRRRPVSGWKKIANWRKRYPLSTFHSFTRRNYEAAEIGIVELTILTADYMKPAVGIPNKLELLHGWTVPEQDLPTMLGDNYVLIRQGKVGVPETRSSVLSALELKPAIFGIRIDLKKFFRWK